MIAPAILYFILFSYVPMPGIILAFKKYSFSQGILGSPWVGFENFKFFFTSGDAFRVTRNTVLYNFSFMVVNTVLQCFCGIALAEMVGRRIKKFMQSVMFLPYFISWVVISAFIYFTLNYEFGALNTVLSGWGMEKINVYTNINAWKYILVFLQAWKSVGYGTVLYLAAIMGIDQEIYEAADIEGANIFTKIRVITLPCLLPTIVTLTLLGVSYVFRADFAMFYNVIGGNSLLYETTDVIDTFIMRTLRQRPNFGMSTAVGAYQSLLNFALILTVNGLVRKFHPSYALF